MTRSRLLSVLMIVAVLLSLAVAPASSDVTVMSGNFIGQYYSNPNLTGSPAFTRTDASINFNWGAGSPAPAIPNNSFSVRWTGTIPVPVAGSYVFKITSDDGCKLWVDGDLLVDEWHVQAATSYEATVSLSAAPHTVKVEYYEATGAATIALSWGLAGSSGTFTAQYWNNMTLSGPAALTRIDSDVNFNWGFASPAPAVSNDYFSVRWTATRNFATTDDYDFHMLIDDGGKLYIDGVLVLNHWYPQAATEHMTTRHITAGPHEIRMDYFEETQAAVAKLWWNVHVPGPVPADVIVDDLDPGFSKGGSPSAWHIATIGWASRMIWTLNATSVQENWARWKPSLPIAGHYEVYAYIPSNYATTHNARYSVMHNGLWNTKAINQYIYYSVWVSLGTFYFSAVPGAEYVFMSDVTYEPYLSHKVGYDAVKFVYRGP